LLLARIDSFDPAEGPHSGDSGFCDGERPAARWCSSPFYFLPRRAASAAIKRSSQSASDRASFCASCKAMALTDGFIRARIETVCAFGFGFFIGLTCGAMESRRLVVRRTRCVRKKSVFGMRTAWTANSVAGRQARCVGARRLANPPPFTHNRRERNQFVASRPSPIYCTRGGFHGCRPVQD